jgi:hypothetical protein
VLSRPRTHPKQDSSSDMTQDLNICFPCLCIVFKFNDEVRFLSSLLVRNHSHLLNPSLQDKSCYFTRDVTRPGTSLPYTVYTATLLIHKPRTPNPHTVLPPQDPKLFLSLQCYIGSWARRLSSVCPPHSRIFCKYYSSCFRTTTNAF